MSEVDVGWSGLIHPAPINLTHRHGLLISDKLLPFVQMVKLNGLHLPAGIELSKQTRFILFDKRHFDQRLFG